MAGLESLLNNPRVQAALLVAGFTTGMFTCMYSPAIYKWVNKNYPEAGKKLDEFLGYEKGPQKNHKPYRFPKTK